MKMLLMAGFVALVLQVPIALAQTGGEATAQVRVLRIRSGPTGNEANGSFTLTSERATFSRTDDREVFVFFEWEGAPGPHRLLAQWRSPDGAASSTSNVDYIARGARFGAYWSLPVTPSMTLGTWSIEATVDGVPAGRFTFEVTDAKVATVPVKPVLTQAALYERLNSTFVAVSRSGKDGRKLRPAAGFVHGPSQVLTLFAALDGADDIQVSLGGATPQRPTSIIAYSRSLNWAVLGAAHDQERPPVAGIEGTRVGTRCFSLQESGGAQVLIEGALTGRDSRGLLIAGFRNGRPTPGAPVMNDFGEVIGVVDSGGLLEASFPARANTSELGTPILPMGLIQGATAAPVSITELRARGVLMPTVIASEHLLTGGVNYADSKGKMVSAAFQQELSTRQKAFAVFVLWESKDRLRGLGTARIFDQENRLVSESKPLKLDIRKGQSATSTWAFSMLSQPGDYRAELVLDGTPVWRGFFRVVP